MSEKDETETKDASLCICRAVDKLYALAFFMDESSWESETDKKITKEHIRGIGYILEDIANGMADIVEHV